MDFTAGSGIDQQVVDGKRISQNRKMCPECQKGDAWLFTAHAAQLLQSVTLKFGDEVFDDLDLQARELR
jgi:hypothetical protein